MSSSFGRNIRVSIFGESHGPAIGAVIDGLPAGLRLDMDEISAFMARRRPGGPLATARRETDEPRILSGLNDGVTSGAPLAVTIENADARSGDYAELRRKPRPMHADYPASVKYAGHNDIRGGGHFSARLTAPLCFAGAIAIQLLAARGVAVGSHIAEAAGERDDPFDAVSVGAEELAAIARKNFPVINDDAGERMRRAVEAVRADGDSAGGVIECAVTGLPAGIGEPLYDNAESAIAAIVFGIPAVKGIEFGAGFAAARMRGSEHNDEYFFADGPAGRSVRARTNRHGGILGGMTTGMPLIFRAAFKPTPSIAREQRTVDLASGEDASLVIKGRHDPCVALRAAPCVEAAAALALADLMASPASSLAPASRLAPDSRLAPERG